MPDPAACEPRWGIEGEGVVFLRRSLCLKSVNERELYVEKVGRVLRGVSTGGAAGMRRCRSPRKLSFDYSALQPPGIVHTNKRLAHVLLALLGREGWGGGKLPLEGTPITLHPPLLDRTDDETEIIVDAATIDAVCRSESALGHPDVHLAATLPRGAPPEGAPAVDVYGTSTFRILISELKRVAASVRVATGSSLPPVFLESLTSFITQPQNRLFFYLRRNIPLRELACEHRWAALRQFYSDGLSSAQLRLTSIGDTHYPCEDVSVEAVAHRSAAHQAKECLSILAQSMAVLDRVAESRVIGKQFDEYLNRVRKAPCLYGFRSAQHVETAISRSLAYLSESLVQVCEGYSLVDGAHHRYNQLTSKTPQPLYFISASPLCDPQSAPIDSISLRTRLRGQYRLILSTARHHNLTAISSPLLLGDTPYGISTLSCREASLRALLEVLSHDDTSLETWYIQALDTFKDEATRLLENALEAGGVYNDPELARCLRTTIVVHQKDAKFIAVELAKRAMPTGLVIPTDDAELLLGNIGGRSWETGRGHYFKPHHEVLNTTTVLMSSLHIAGMGRFKAAKVLHEDTEGWGTVISLPKKYEIRKPYEVGREEESQPRAEAQQVQEAPMSPVKSDTEPQDDALLVSLCCSDESCIVEVCSLPDAEGVAKESFDAVGGLPPGGFHLSYMYEGRKRVVKTEKHFRTFLNLARKRQVGTDGGLPELCVAVKERKVKVDTPSSSGLTATPPSPLICAESTIGSPEVCEPIAAPIPETQPSGVVLARLELERCQEKLASLEEEQMQYEEGRVWQNELVEFTLRSMDASGGTPLLCRSLSVHKRNVTSFNCMLELIKTEIGYLPDVSYMNSRGKAVSVYDDLSLHLFLQEKWGDLLLFVTKRSFKPVVASQARVQTAKKPKTRTEYSMVNVTFNPPSIKVAGNMEQKSIELLSKKLATVCPTQRKAKRVPALNFNPTPHPHWAVTYPYAFADQTVQSVIFAAILDSLHATGGWQLRDASSCTCPINLPRSAASSTAPDAPVMVDFYKFALTREVCYKNQKKKRSKRTPSVDKHPAPKDPLPERRTTKRTVYTETDSFEPALLPPENRVIPSDPFSSQLPQEPVALLPRSAYQAPTSRPATHQPQQPQHPTPPAGDPPPASEEVLKYSARERKLSAGKVGLKVCCLKCYARQIWGNMTWEQRLVFLKAREANTSAPSVALTQSQSQPEVPLVPPRPARPGRRRSLSVGAQPSRKW